MALPTLDPNAPDFTRRYPNLADPRLGAVATFATDEFFAPKDRMLNPEPAVFIPGKYDDHGKWMDGWETRRRRNGGYDHCIVKLARPGVVKGVDIDTSHFTGNFPPAASIEAAYLPDGEPTDATQWTEIVPSTTLQGNSHAYVAVANTGAYTHLRVNIFPDGGIARMRAWGVVARDFESELAAEAVGKIDLLSALNGGRAHAWNALGAHGMRGQGDGFRLGPGEYQIVPFSSSSCWLGGSLGCCAHGNDCHVSPSGRGAGTDASPSGQPNTLFEWTAPGVWDASLVDGFGLPMKVEVDGCGKPGSGTAADCGGSDPVTYLSFEPAKCPNPILTTVGTAAAASEAGQQQHYVGCKSMCGCQNRARQLGNDTDGGCPGMAGRSAIENEPHPPGGYCGCAQGDCVAWLRGLFSRDAAGQRYCDAITDMAHGADGKRAVYCQAYDDNAGTRSYGNGVVKVTLCNAGFEFAQDRAGQC